MEYKSDLFNKNYELTTKSQPEADSIVKSYPEGKETVCYVNPKNPYEAVLETGAGPYPRKMWYNIGLGIFLILFGGYCYFSGR